MVLGFLPGVDIVADARDFFYLEVLNCSGLWGCATAFAWDTVELFSVVPVFGKAGDVLHAGKTVAEAGKSTKIGEKALRMKSIPEVLKAYLDGKRGYWAAWKDPELSHVDRGHVME